MKISNLPLAYKGMVLVAVPLLLSSVFLWIVTFSLQTEWKEEQREVQAKDIEFETEVLQKRLTEAGLATANVVFFHNDTSDLLDASLNDIPIHIQNLKRLLATDPRNTKRVEEISATVEEILRLGKSGRNIYRSGGRSLEFDTASEFIDTMQQLTNRLIRTLHEIALDAKETQKLSGAAKQNAIQSLTVTVVTAQIALIVLAIAFALAFYKTIGQRLVALLDNIHRFAADKPLIAPIGGNDEIGHLHKVFHSMADTIAEQKRAKQEFIAIVSHDLRTPLTSIQATLHLLSTGSFGAVSQDISSRVTFCNREVDRLMSLVNDILDLDKLESGQMSVFPEETVLQDVLTRSLGAVQSVADNHKVQLQLVPNDYIVYADPDRVIQVVINLVGNAVKFSPAGQTVTVSAHTDDEFVRIEVADRGRGVPNEMKDKVFERFAQVEPGDSKEKRGTGLGLSICKAIAASHSGEIGVQDNEGSGSIFWFTLPRLRKKKKKSKSDAADPGSAVSEEQCENLVQQQ